MSFRLFGLEWNSRWKTLSIYEKFEQLIVSILTWIIGELISHPKAMEAMMGMIKMDLPALEAAAREN